MPSLLLDAYVGVRIASTVVAAVVADLSGIIVAGNRAAIALAKNAKRFQFAG